MILPLQRGSYVRYNHGVDYKGTPYYIIHGIVTNINKTGQGSITILVERIAGGINLDTPGENIPGHPWVKEKVYVRGRIHEGHITVLSNPKPIS